MATNQEGRMRRISAREAKNRFGELIDTARAEPVAIEKHGRPVAVILSIEAYDHLASHHAPKRGEKVKKTSPARE